ncbi:MAG TPA: NAD(P)/FAD-dependent oxidoreductase [Longimicrobiales bacterium]|nr:NAD(P)/FAD-dependent oxidoreductase [Longimicrobiales bacterium]
MATEPWDAIVVGGGPAGLSAAMWLGRYRRRVLLFDAGEPRNEPAWAVHGYPGIVDPSPLELRRRLQQQALGEGVEVRAGEIVKVQGGKDNFTASSDTGEEHTARRIVLAYGLRDYLPDIDGLEDLYGTSVFHCPDCDGPSFADTGIGVVGWDRYGANLALYLRHWSSDITLLTHGRDLEVDDDAVTVIRNAGIRIVPDPVTRVDGRGGNLTQAEFDGREPLRLDAVFFHLGSEPRCELAELLNCELDRDGYVVVDKGQETSTPGVHAIGDITGHPHLASIAAAEGVRAALAVHRSLLPEERLLE